jgi:hypothetical protein
MDTVAFACLFSVNKRFKLGQGEDDDSDLGVVQACWSVRGLSRSLLLD